MVEGSLLTCYIYNKGLHQLTLTVTWFQKLMEIFFFLEHPFFGGSIGQFTPYNVKWWYIYQHVKTVVHFIQHLFKPTSVLPDNKRKQHKPHTRDDNKQQHIVN